MVGRGLLVGLFGIRRASISIYIVHLLREIRRELNALKVTQRYMVGGRLFSRLKPESYEFKPYNAERLYEIIEHRIKQAYSKLIISKEALSTLCDFIAEECESNVRYLFKLFLSSADIASKNGESSIRLATVKEVIEKERQVVAKSSLNEIKSHAPRMYQVLKIIAELQSKQAVYTGLIKEEIRKRGLAISEMHA